MLATVAMPHERLQLDQWRRPKSASGAVRDGAPTRHPWHSPRDESLPPRREVTGNPAPNAACGRPWHCHAPAEAQHHRPGITNQKGSGAGSLTPRRRINARDDRGNATLHPRHVRARHSDSPRHGGRHDTLHPHSITTIMAWPRLSPSSSTLPASDRAPVPGDSGRIPIRATRRP